ncbi:MAG: c-type cytochrome [Acidobacteriota bacterium]|nr:c-type cytochrome [Acidobacteriota bacterium]
MPKKPPVGDDPVLNRSLGRILLISSLLMVASLLWALYDETYGLRPWKDYQKHFASLYSRHLRRIQPTQARAEQAVLQSAEYRKLSDAVTKAEESIAPRISDLDRETNRIVGSRLSVITEPFAITRSEIAALIYQIETSTNQSEKEALQRQIDAIKAREMTLRLASANGAGEVVEQEERFNFDQLEAEFNRLQARRAELGAQRAELVKSYNELRGERDTLLGDRLTGLTASQVRGLRARIRNFELGIRQIHVAEVDLVDRCESCHLGIREPLVLTKADMGGEEVFVSHPNPALLALHDPEQFGCSTCHNGNGRATTSVRKGHGRHKYWLWPLYYKENFEAGCHQCHAKDLVLDHAEVLNRGKEIYYVEGCAGCHRFEGFDTEAEALSEVQSSIHALAEDRKDMGKEIEQSVLAGDNAQDNAEAQRYYARADELKQQISNLDHEMERLEVRSADLQIEQKNVGPSLKEVRFKMRKEWIPVWLENPHAYRPSTKMPAFRLDEGQRRAISAFVWQTGIEGELPSQPRGNAVRGKELFETRGCMGCHAVGEGDAAQGSSFAANLSRVGEKVHYDYLVPWIHNPQERQPLSVMPSLRLSLQETRDIASYLVTLKQADASYPEADYLEDPALKSEGSMWVKHFGCAGCHEIAGFEEEGRIGTELTREGSKPIERLDFALLTHEAKHDGWYNHKGFFERKLKNPAIFDQGKIKNPVEKLRMPNFKLTDKEIAALTTFLLGSVDSTLPEHFFYAPGDRGQDIREGWWLVQRYNCMGCHQVRPGQQSDLSGMALYQDPDWKEQLPPTLVGEGARVDPDWLARFLRNPAMDSERTDRNGVRGYLHARMPTFRFSDSQIQKIVRFFEALAAQDRPYIPTQLEPLSNRERELARQLFTSKAAPCLRCHATGDPAHDRNATAPNFLLAGERLKPGWTERWMVAPEMIAPGTAMPSGLFQRDGERWVFAGSLPPAFRDYPKDHAELLVRYMFQLTPQEQRRLMSRMPAAATSVASR